MTRVLVMHGLLLEQGFEKDSPDGVVQISGLERPLASLDGLEPPQFYRGPGARNGAVVVLGNPQKEAALYEYRVGDPTQESVDRRMGELHAAEQKRMRQSLKKSEAWWRGWIEVWTQRRPAKVTS